MIDVLSVASEVFPLIKTGGLADVAGALPGALALHGVSVRTLVPGYPAVLGAVTEAREVAGFTDLWGGPARLLAGAAHGLDLIVLDAPHLFDRPGGPYVRADGTDWPDNWARFAALSWAGAELTRGLVEGYRPEVLHAHDWQAALAPVYLRYGAVPGARSVLTVHNLAFQGRFDAEIFAQLRLSPQAYAMDGVEYYGGVGFLKGGLQSADAITTVSPTYASEIRTRDFGMGLDGLLNMRADALTGILNGIDTSVWDPARDPHLAENYRASSVNHRAGNKRALEEKFGLETGDGPIFAVVSRLTWQKGIDLLLECVDDMVAAGGRLCLLGSGEPQLEEGLLAAARRHPGKIGIIIGYDEPLSHLMQGGADAILIPSRFEPCGLTQLFGLRYGCVPVVARVGGLTDTVIDANAAAVDAGVATGVQFAPVTASGLAEGISRTIALYGREKVWKKIQRRGMKSDVSWEASAERYAALYAKISGRIAHDDD